MQRTTWLYGQLGPDRHVLELDERLTPRDCALEVEVLDGAGMASTFLVWRLSQTGAVLAIVEADEA